MKSLFAVVFALGIAVFIHCQIRVCQPGFYTDPSGACQNCSLALPNCQLCDNKTMCTLCESGHMWINNSCTSVLDLCDPGFYFDPATSKCANCSSSLPYCEYCENGQSCLICSEGYLPDNGTCRSTHNITCQIGLYLDLNSLKCINCSDTMKGCEFCLNSTYCIECEPGWNMTNGMCSPDIRGGCPEGSFMDSISMSCIPCATFMPNCTACIDSTKCMNCTEGMQLLNGVCVLLISTCATGTYFNPSTNSCHACNASLQNCSACDNATFCTICSDGTPSSSGSCTQRIALEGQASICPDGAFPSDSGLCQPCILFLDNCIGCANSTWCTNCTNNSKLSNGKCVIGPVPPSGGVVPVNGTCPVGYFFNNSISNATAVCTLCSSIMVNCSICSDANNCLNCTNGSTVENGVCAPLSTLPSFNVSCYSGQYYNASVATCLNCNQTLPACISCRNSTLCEACLAGTNLRNGACYIFEGQNQCEVGAYLDPSNGNCVNCNNSLANCTACLNLTVCLNCTLGNSLINGTCIAVVAGPTPPSPSPCPAGSYFDTVANKCVNCSDFLPNCLACGSSTTCTLCMSNATLANGTCVASNAPCDVGAFMDPGTGVCLNCSSVLPNCTACLNSTICLNCTQGNSLMNGTCVLVGPIFCTNGSFFDPAANKCIFCKDVLPNCTNCINSTVCLNCNTGSLMVNGMCVAVIGGQCPPAYFKNPGSGNCTLCSLAIPNCTFCDNSTSCTKCTEGNKVFGGTCISIFNITAGECPLGMYKDPASNGCLSCLLTLPNCTACLNATYCTNCAPGSVLSSGVCIPGAISICPTGTYRDAVNGSCVSCSAAIFNCTMCDNSSFCLNCSNGSLAINGTCTFLPGAACQPGFYRDPTMMTCNECGKAIQFCQRCENATVCLECDQNHVLANGTCGPPARRRLRILHQKEGCTGCHDGMKREKKKRSVDYSFCGEGSYYDEDSGTCMESKPN